METIRLRDKNKILSFLMKNPEVQYYCIGDLDDFFWPHTQWLGLADNGTIKAVALIYSGGGTPALLMFHDGNADYSIELFQKIRNTLPPKFYAHLSPGLIDQFSRDEIKENHGTHFKMILKKPVKAQEDTNIKRLSASDLPVILDLYSIAYPDNWFDPKMLQTGKYFGYYLGGDLIGISGIHVYSPQYRVAALGNIATLPDYRGRGIAFSLTVQLCNDLLKEVNIIGLNVRHNNDYAVKCYKKAGFEISGTYDECLINMGE